MTDPSLVTLPVEGNPESPVRVVAYEDLQCKDCAAWRSLLDDILLPRFSQTVAFVSRDFPLDKHDWAEHAAVVSRRLTVVSAEQGIDFRRYCYEHLAEISVENFLERVVAYAEAAGLDSEDISISVRNVDFQRAVALDRAEGLARGVKHTPTVFAGRLQFVEHFAAGAIIASIDEALRT